MGKDFNYIIQAEEKKARKAVLACDSESPADQKINNLQVLYP